MTAQELQQALDAATEAVSVPGGVITLTVPLTVPGDIILSAAP